MDDNYEYTLEPNHYDIKLHITDPAHNYDTAVGIFRAFISPIISIIGIIGNIFIIIIFTREIKISRFSIYCISLAITHSIALFMNSFLDDFLGRGLTYVTNYSHLMSKLDLLSNASCKIMEYLPNAMYSTSSSLIILFAIDRLLTIYKPIKYFSGQYIIFAIFGSLVCLIMGLTLNIPLLISYRLIQDDYNSILGWQVKCESSLDKNSTYILAEFGLYNKVIGAFILPTFIVLILNIIICWKLCLLHYERKRLLNPNLKNKCKTNNLRLYDNEMSRIIGHIVFNTAFLFLNMPLVIVMILRLNMPIKDLSYEQLYYQNSLKHLSRLFSSFKDISYAVNFFVYLKFLPNFYDGMVNVLKTQLCCCFNNSQNNNETMVKINDARRSKTSDGKKITEKITVKLTNIIINSNSFKKIYRNNI